LKPEILRSSLAAALAAFFFVAEGRVEIEHALGKAHQEPLSSDIEARDIFLRVWNEELLLVTPYDQQRRFAGAEGHLDNRPDLTVR
jgi:hypothetical protein